MKSDKFSDDIDFDFVDSILSYDEKTGVLVWKSLPSRKARLHLGRPAGCLHHTGYIQIGIRQRKYRAHRLAWLLSTGNWPDGEINHINGVKDDNRLTNLEVVTSSENALHAYRLGLRRADGPYNGRAIGKRRLARMLAGRLAA